MRFTTARDCWVALPAALLSRLLDSGAPLPLVLELRPAGPAGEVLTMSWPCIRLLVQHAGGLGTIGSRLLQHQASRQPSAPPACVNVRPCEMPVSAAGGH